MRKYLFMLLCLFVLITIDSNAQIVGYTNVQTTIGENGQATASVHIATPKGTFLEPNLYLTYSSQNPNSYCGIGFAVDGIFQAITRVPATLDQDGFADGRVNDPNAGRYALNGERLKATFSYSDNVNSTNPSDSYLYNAGQANSSAAGAFRTEQESFSKILVYASGKAADLGDARFYADSFRVYTKDGLILEFGFTPDSRTEKSSTKQTISWLLNKISDRNGNYVDIRYTKNASNNENYPFEILYTGNVNKSLLPYAKVSFLYETRPDSITRFQNGSLVRLTKRLKSIIAYDHGDIWRRYELTYMSDNLASKLNSVKEYGTDNTSFLKPVNFSWKQQPVNQGFTKAGSGIWNGHAGGAGNNIIGDFDGNGLMDMAGHFGNGLWHISLSTGTGFINSNWQASLNTAFSRYVGDFNGDGKADFASLRNGRWQVSLSNGHTFSNSDWSGTFTAPAAGYVTTYIGDVNGDGLSDAICYGGSGNWHQFISNGSSFTHVTYNDGCTTCAGQALVGDFNADGKSDVINQAFLTTINGATVANSFVADMNGDGISDIVSFAGNSQWKVSLSNGTGASFTTTVWSAHNSGIANNVVGDFNKDGMEDIATHVAGGTPNWHVYLSTGKSFRDMGIWSGHAGELGNNAVADFDGDGASDLVGYTGIPGVWYVSISNAENDLISSVQNGNGVTSSFNYDPITNKNIYQKDTTGVYPNIDFTSPLVVASALKIDDGTGGIRTMYYKYGNATYNLRGRGFRGFDKLTITDSLANTVSTTWFSADEKSIATRPFRAEIRTVNNILLSRSDNTVKVNKILFAKDSVFYSFYSKTVDSIFDLNSGFYDTKKTEYSYDEFENALQTVETGADGYSVISKNTFVNDQGDWIIGQLVTSEIIKNLPGHPLIDKKASFQYNSKGYLISEIILPDDAKLKLQTDYLLDDFGNKVKKTVSGPGINPRSISFSFNQDGNLQLQTTNELGHNTRTTYKLQLPESLISVNGLVTTTQRDPFGRELLIKNPDNTSKKTSYYDCGTGVNYCPPTAVYFVKEEATGQPSSYNFYDKLDRPVRSVSESFGNNPVIITDKIYNADGTLKRQSEPYFLGSNILWTEFEYDAVKRLIKKTEPANRVSTVSISGYTTITTNEEGQKFTRIKNSRSKIIRTIDNNGSALTFDYDSDDNLLETTDPNNNKIKNYFDLRGNKISMSDPDMGTYTYEYNTLGQLVKQLSPSGAQTLYEYDILGRQKKRTEMEGVTEWEYDPLNALGSIARILLNGKVKQAFTYDNLARIQQADYFVQNTKKSYSYRYNALTGILLSIQYPNNVVVEYQRTANGYLNQIVGTNIKILPVTMLTANNYNQYGELTSWRLGNNVIVNKKFDAITNYLTEIKSGPANYPDSIQNLLYTYSSLGNLMSRADNHFALKEEFSYDVLNRLTKTSVSRSGVPTTIGTTINYDRLGNIIFKSDVGNYLYGQNGKGPHTLTAIDNSTVPGCAYNFNQKISYTSYNYLSKAENGSTEISYMYGPERNREMMAVKKDGLFVEIKKYYGDLYEEVLDRYGDSSYAYQVRNGTEVIAMVGGSHRTGQFKDSISYMLQDHLGSVYATTDENGRVRERISYDAWGKPRDPYTWDGYTRPSKLPSFEKGYTFHEMMDMDFLICMNARAYNPVLGRFLSPDPFVQSPENLQSYNRFSYVLNNPLIFTDPTGYFKLGKFLKKWAPTIVGLAITAFTAGAGSMLLSNAILSGAAAGFGSAFTGGIISGQSLGAAFKLGLQGGIIGGISGGLMNGVDQAFPSLLSQRAAGSTASFLDRLETQGINSVLRSSVNGLATLASGGSFFKSFSNSLAWEGVGILNAEIVMENTKYESEDMYEGANPTTYEGDKDQYQRPREYNPNDKTTDPYYRSTNPYFKNVGQDWMANVEKPGLLTNGGGLMNFFNSIPGVNYHSNIHDPFVSMLYRISPAFRDNTFANFFANFPTQGIIISNYGVLINHLGLSNYNKRK